MFSKILIPVVFSPRCAWAVRYGTRLAARLGGEAILLHAGDTENPAELDAFVAREAPGAGCRRLSVRGDPAHRIIEVARRESADLILMPTHAYGPYRRFLLGSVTAKVLHDASCPVWTGVHQEEVPQSDEPVFRNFVVGVDLEPHCIGLIRWALDLARALGAAVRVVHAIPAADSTSDNRGEIELRQHLFRSAEEGFERVLQNAGLRIPIALAGGSVARVVREAALAQHAELVVIGRGHSPQALGRLRTCAYAVIRESPCPVVSV